MSIHGWMHRNGKIFTAFLDELVKLTAMRFKNHGTIFYFCNPL